MNQGDIRKIVKSGDENKLIQLLTSMNNRIIVVEKQKVDNKDFKEYKRKKKDGLVNQAQVLENKDQKENINISMILNFIFEDTVVNFNSFKIKTYFSGISL